VIPDELKNCKSVLLLQGPRGPFFTRFSRYLQKKDISVHKINFNGGDELFYPGNSIPFRGRIEDFEEYLEDFFGSRDIGCIFLFGDCRPHHQIAKKVALRHEIDVYVFEEGYIRPDYITMEKSGVNGFSSIPFNPYFYKGLDGNYVERPLPAATSFLKTASAAVVYHLAEAVMRWKYPHYRYHKKFSLLTEPFFWVRSAVRKYIYRFSEKSEGERIFNDLSGKYFFVPLQVHDDSQVLFHSKYKNIEEFIEEVLASFAQNASSEQHIIFKHHPMDRGHKDYRLFISRQARLHNIEDRVIYVHDIHLPKLLRHAKGVIVINSTVGLSALYHSTPLKVMGNSIYCINGLTYQESLDEFWRNPGSVNNKLYMRFRAFIIQKTQLNGSFYGLFPFRDEETVNRIDNKQAESDSA
jgi:capsule polysaccharide modification protein KpsS